MIHLFEGHSANEVWQLAVSCFREQNAALLQQSRGGTTKELLHAVFAIQDPLQRWIVSREPPINPAFAIAEVVWILCGRNDVAFLSHWNSKLPKYVGFESECHGAYGFRLRTHFGIDQLERAYLALRSNPHGRQVVLQIWDPRVDLPFEDGTPVSPDVPCNISSLLKIRNGKLEWMQIIRSNDLFRGVPYNIIQFTSIQEVLAGWLGVGLGSYNQLSDSLHLYEVDFNSLNHCSDVQVSPNLDAISLPRERSKMAFSELNRAMDALRAPELTCAGLQQLASTYDRPQAFQNMFLVVAAETARRRGWTDIADTLMRGCTNSALMQVWERWLERVQRSAHNNYPLSSRSGHLNT